MGGMKSGRDLEKSGRAKPQRVRHRQHPRTNARQRANLRASTMASDLEVAEFIRDMALATKREGPKAISRFAKERPGLYIMSIAQISKILEGPKEQLECFLDGLDRILK
jgi:hypothetical protein